MKIVIPGGSGQVGTILARAFHGSGDEVVVLSRESAACVAPGEHATIYAHRYDAPNDERSGILGGHEPGADAARDLCERTSTSAPV